MKVVVFGFPASTNPEAFRTFWRAERSSSAVRMKVCNGKPGPEIFVRPILEPKMEVPSTPRKINMEPESTPLENQTIIFRFYVNLPGCNL